MRRLQYGEQRDVLNAAAAQGGFMTSTFSGDLMKCLTDEERSKFASITFAIEVGYDPANCGLVKLQCEALNALIHATRKGGRQVARQLHHCFGVEVGTERTINWNTFDGLRLMFQHSVTVAPTCRLTTEEEMRRLKDEATRSIDERCRKAHAEWLRWTEYPGGSDPTSGGGGGGGGGGGS